MKNIQKIILLLLGFCGSIAACSYIPSADTQEDVFFSLKKYFAQEALRVQKLRKSVRKTLIHNQIAQTKNLSVENWDEELEVFSNSDINRRAWLDKYHADTSSLRKNHFSISYTALDSGLKTRNIQLWFHHKKIDSIHICNRTQNLLYTSDEELVYVPNSTYRIKKHVKTLFLSPEQYQIIGHWK